MLYSVFSLCFPQHITQFTDSLEEETTQDWQFFLPVFHRGQVCTHQAAPHPLCSLTLSYQSDLSVEFLARSQR